MAHILKDKDVIDEFWDKYESDGINAALEYAKTQSNGNLTILEGAVPYLVDEARSRGIKVKDFLEELDKWYLEQTDDTSRTTDDGGRVRTVGDSEANIIEDESSCSTTESNDTGVSSKD